MSAATAALAALVLVPAGTGAALLLAGRRADGVAGPLALAGAGIGVVLAAVAAVERPAAAAPFLGVVDGGELALAVDGLSAVLVVMITLVAAAVITFAVVDLPRGAARARFFGYLLLFVAAMLGTVTATTLPTLLLAWEVMGATSYALIAYRWDVPGKVQAGTTAFLVTRAGDLGLYVAAGAALAGAGTLELDALAGADGGWQHVIAAGVLVAALGKSAQLPFSAWLSAAMEGPSPVSALLHSATMVAAGGYLLLRTMPLLDASGWAATTAAWVGVATALLLGAVACAQTDLKQLLAASTAAQIGFVVLAAGAGTTTGGAAQLVAHAAVKAGLFVAAGSWLTALGTKQLGDLRGVARRHRGTGVAAVIMAVALAGVPPLSLWAAKDEVLAATGGALHIAGLAAAALSAVYAGRILAVLLSRPDGREARDVDERGTRVVPATTTAIAAGFAVAAAGLGVIAVPGVRHALETVLGTDAPAPGVTELALSGSVAVVVLLLTVWGRRGLARLDGTVLTEWAGLPRLLSPGPFVAVARVAASVDDRIIDRAVMGLARAVRRAAGAIGRADDLGVDRAVRTVAEAIRRSGTAARRPQTGLLHQYYIQTVAGLGALFVVLLLVAW